MGKSYLNNAALPRGLRNNNPGNLVRSSIAWQGKVPHSQSRDTRFEQFTELRWGIRALMLDLINDFNEGKRTVKSLISEFAPAFENNTAAYIANVAAMVGVGATQAIPVMTREILLGFCKAIVFVENGSAFNGYVTDADYQEAYAVLGRTLPTTKKKN